MLGDYVLGIGSVTSKLQGHITFWMQVDEILTFDEYWNDIRFQRKKPLMEGTTYLRYGDNIYHRDDETELLQEDSFHSLEDGSMCLGDLRRDTGTTEKVLIGREFAYWGRSSIKLPNELNCFVITGPGHKSNFSEKQIEGLMGWLAAHPERGFLDEPAHWQFLGRTRRTFARKRLVA